MSMEGARELIQSWNRLKKQLDSPWLHDPNSEVAFVKILPIFAALREAAYLLTNDDYCYYPKKANG
jgi:hypothetical protein